MPTKIKFEVTCNACGASQLVDGTVEDDSCCCATTTYIDYTVPPGWNKKVIKYNKHDFESHVICCNVCSNLKRNRSGK